MFPCPNFSPTRSLSEDAFKRLRADTRQLEVRVHVSWLVSEMWGSAFRRRTIAESATAMKDWMERKWHFHGKSDQITLHLLYLIFEGKIHQFLLLVSFVPLCWSIRWELVWSATRWCRWDLDGCTHCFFPLKGNIHGSFVWQVFRPFVWDVFAFSLTFFLFFFVVFPKPLTQNPFFGSNSLCLHATKLMDGNPALAGLVGKAAATAQWGEGSLVGRNFV